jgi:hypothetical protein
MSLGVVQLLEIVDVEQGEGYLGLVALRARDLMAQGLGEVPAVEEPGQTVRDRRALGLLEDRDLDDLRVLELLVDVQEIVEERHSETEVASEPGLDLGPVGPNLLPVPLGLALLEGQVGQDEEDGGVEGLVLVVRAAVFELRQQAVFVGRIRLQKLEEGVPKADAVVIGRWVHSVRSAPGLGEDSMIRAPRFS